MTKHSGKTSTIYWNAFLGLLGRDTRVLSRQFAAFLARTMINPLLFVFVFTYVFPKIGQNISNSQAHSFATVILPGLMALGIFSQGIMAVALPLAVELDATREIHDRAMAPVPIALVAAEKIIFSALQSIIAACVIFPLVKFVSAVPVDIDIASWPLLAIMIPLAALASGAVGLALGTFVRPQQISLVFSIVLVPITFLGCVYYPWAALHNVRWLQISVLINPLVYMSEGLRVALTAGVPHMPTGAVLSALFFFLISMTWLGTRGFIRRVVT